MTERKMHWTRGGAAAECSVRRRDPEWLTTNLDAVTCHACLNTAGRKAVLTRVEALQSAIDRALAEWPPELEGTVAFDYLTAAVDPDDPCTGIAAAWCPTHGDCTCPRIGDGGRETGGDDTCPLHGHDTSHRSDNRDRHPHR